MSLLLEYIENNPKETKLNWYWLWEATAIIYSSWSFALWKQAEIEADKFRLNSKGAGCKPKLSLREQMLLTLVYLSQLHNHLGVQFGVSESTANNIFHYWLDIFTELLPAVC